MKTLKRLATLMLMALLLGTPAYAGLESCRDPTPDEQFQLDLCSAHAGCRVVTSLISGCASVTNTIKKFFSSEKPALDPGEYKGDRDAPLDASDLEQARKDREQYQLNRGKEESAARDAYTKLVVLDRSIKARLEKHCGDPLDQSCKDAVHDAELLVYKFDTYNSNADFVRLRGKLMAESPGIAAPYGKLQEKAWEETKKKMDALGKSTRETEESRDNAGTMALPRRGGNSGSTLFQNAINQAEQEEKDRPAREARERKEKALAAERERLASIKAAADARAYEQEQARKDEQDSRDTAAALGTLLGTIATIEQNKADRKQAQRDEQQRQLLAQQEQQSRIQEQQNRAYREEAARAEAFNREAARTEASRREAALADNQRAFQQQRELDVTENNRRARETQEQYEIANKKMQAEIDAKRKAKAEEDKYYPPLTCASVSSKSSSNGTIIPCMQNNCGRTIEVHHSGGMWSAGAGKCYSHFRDTVFYAACEKNDGYEHGRNQCRR